MGKIVALPKTERLQCSACGATAEASCSCGVPYLPAGARAAAAITADNKRSDRAIAAEIGVNRETVGRVRKQLAGTQPVGKDATDTRVGRDGKVRRPPRKPAPPDDDVMPTQEEADESYQQTCFDHACQIVDLEMSGETRQRFFAHLRRRYSEKFYQNPAQARDKGLPA